jgi:hypothetical protein
MEAIFVLLVAFPLGFFVTKRLTAIIAYLAGHLPLFTFQTLHLITNWAEGDEAAFGGPFPKSDAEAVFGYGVVNLVIYLAGFGLLQLGHWLGAKRRARRTARRTVNLDPVG